MRVLIVTDRDDDFEAITSSLDAIDEPFETFRLDTLHDCRSALFEVAPDVIVVGGESSIDALPERFRAVSDDPDDVATPVVFVTANDPARSEPDEGGIATATTAHLAEIVVRRVREFREQYARLAAASDLGRSAEHLHLVADTLNSLIMYVDTKLRFRFGNTVMEDWFGLERGDWMGRSVRDVIRSSTCKTIAPWIQAAFTGSTETFHASLPHRDGTERSVSTTLVPHRNGDRVRGIYIILHDITERRRQRAERIRLQRAVEHSMTGYARVDDEGHFLHASAIFARMHGYEPHEIVGLPGWALVVEEDREIVVEALQSLESETHTSCEVRGLRKDGTTFFKELSIVKERDGDRVTRFGFARDVSSRVSATAEKRELIEQLRQAQKLEAVGTLASSVAHDFNNVLFALRGYIDLVGESVPTNRLASKWLDKMRDVCSQASDLTKALLTFSHKTPTAMQRVDWAAEIEQTLALLRRAVPAQASLLTHVEGRRKFWVHASPNGIQQVLMNLALNARDAIAADGTIEITLSDSPSAAEPRIVSPPDEGHGTAYLTVRDNGCGIQEAFESRLFEPFFTTKVRDRGTGLGLSVVHGIVKEHRGEIEFASIPGKGTTFVVALPLADPAKLDDNQGATTAEPRASSELILLADDSQVCEILQLSLTSRGFRVVTASNGTEAIERLQTHRDEIALVILVSDLPGPPDGGLLPALRQIHAQVPILVQSGNPELDVPVDGPITVISKPFPLPDLIRAIYEIVAKPESGD